jgi:hypothetical protein
MLTWAEELLGKSTKPERVLDTEVFVAQVIIDDEKWLPVARENLIRLVRGYVENPEAEVLTSVEYNEEGECFEVTVMADVPPERV